MLPRTPQNRTWIPFSAILAPGDPFACALARRFPLNDFHSKEPEYNESFRGRGGGGALLRNQPIPALLGDQDLRPGGVFFDLLPQAIDMRLQRMGGDGGVEAPHLD